MNSKKIWLLILSIFSLIAYSDCAAANIQLTNQGHVVTTIDPQTADLLHAVRNIYGEAYHSEAQVEDISIPIDQIFTYFSEEDFLQHFIPLLEQISRAVYHPEPEESIILQLQQTLVPYFSSPLIAYIADAADYLHIPLLLEALKKDFVELMKISLPIHIRDAIKVCVDPELINSVPANNLNHLCLSKSAFTTECASYIKSNFAKIFQEKWGRIQSLPAQETTVIALAISPNIKKIAIGLLNKKAKVLNLETGATIELINPGEVQFMQFIPDNDRLLTISSDKEGRYWDANSGILLDTVDFSTLDITRVASFSLSPDNPNILLPTFRDKPRVLWPITGAADTKKGLLPRTAYAKSKDQRFSVAATTANVIHIYKRNFFGDDNGQTSLAQALFVYLLYRLEKVRERLDLREAKLLLNVFLSFNKDAARYLQIRYGILLPEELPTD